MSKQVNVEAIQPVADGPIFGKVSDPDDFKKSQQYAHEHTERVTRDAVMAGSASAKVAGFNLTLTTGLSFTIVTGAAFSLPGKLYDADPAPSAVTLAAAHATLPRIDLVYLLLEDDAQAEIEFRPYQQLPTDIELAQPNPPDYPFEQFERPQELLNRATVQVRVGTPNASPAAPAANANEIALFQVRVNATATTLVSGNVTDVRPLLRSTSQLFSDITALQTATTAEAIQDIVGAFLQAGWAVTLNYNDAGNLESIAVDQAVLDARYVNVAGAEQVEGPIVLGTPLSPAIGDRLVIADTPYSDVSSKTQLLIIDTGTSFDNNPMAGIRFASKVSGAPNYGALAAIQAGKESAVADDNAGFLVFLTRVTGGGSAQMAERIRIASTGKVGINRAGASIDAQLHVKAKDDTTPVSIEQAAAAQTANIKEWQSSAGAIHGTVSENGYFTTRKTTAPADLELSNGEMAFWLDASVGATKAMFKAKDSAGNVRTGSIPLT